MKKIIKVKTDKLFYNLTNEIKKASKLWNKSGIVNVYTPHTTCSIWLTEDELLHHADVRFFLDKVAPKWKDPEGDHKNIKYLHDLISLRKNVPVNERINGHSHIRSLFFSSSEMIPIDNGNLLLGEWKKIFLIELDPVRDREVICTFLESK